MLPLHQMGYRTIVIYGDHFETFLSAQRPKVQEKILQTLRIIEEVERIPSIYLKHIEGTAGLFEVGYNSDQTYSVCSASLMREN